MKALSSNHFSVDDQINDVVSALDLLENPAFVNAFAEYGTLVWSGSWVDAAESGVDPEYMNWVVDWIESNTDVYWEEGEPWLREPGDEEESDDDL